MPQQDYENPFDRPLDSEVQDHQQAQAVTVQTSDNGNPFDEPLMSEKAETHITQQQQAYRKATTAGPFAPAGAAEKAMGEAIGDRKAQEAQALHDVGQAALMTTGGVVGASEFAPVAAKVVEYLPHLARIVKTARDLSLTGFGLKEAHDLYKWFAGDQK